MKDRPNGIRSIDIRPNGNLSRIYKKTNVSYVPFVGYHIMLMETPNKWLRYFQRYQFHVVDFRICFTVTAFSNPLMNLGRSQRKVWYATSLSLVRTCMFGKLEGTNRSLRFDKAEQAMASHACNLVQPSWMQMENIWFENNDTPLPSWRFELKVDCEFSYNLSIYWKGYKKKNSRL